MTLNKRYDASPDDRKAAVDLLRRLAFLEPRLSNFEVIAERIKAGGHDDTIWVQVFAAHRLAALAGEQPE